MISVVFLAVGALRPSAAHAQEPGQADAETAPEAASEEAAALEEEAVADEAAAVEDAQQVADTVDAATETAATKFSITGPGGVPLEATPSDEAIDAVKKSMAKIVADAESGTTKSYMIVFGDTSDWLQLDSGEWLKGEILRMRDDTIEFDSDDLGKLTVDLDDVLTVHSPNVNTFVFDKRISATGVAVITEDKVLVETEDGTQAFDRSELEGIVAGGQRERDWWSMKLRFGLTLNRGNTDQLTYDVLFSVVREDEMTLLDLSYNSSFGRTGGVQNVNRHLGEFDFKVFLSSRWFVSPTFGQLFNDKFQNIRFRATPATGAGVHIIDESKVTWDFQTGAGYQFLNYVDSAGAPAGVSDPQSDFFIPLYTYADFDITDNVDLTVSWLTNLVVTTIGNTNHTGKADLAIELNDYINLDIAFLFLRTERPAPPAEPTDPPIERNDYQLIAGISLELG